MAIPAGYADASITPSLPVQLCGYGVFLDRLATCVLDELHVRAAVFDDGSERFALLSYDLIGLSVDFACRFRRAVASALDTRADRVTVTCTHNHSGPPSAPLRGMGEVERCAVRPIGAGATLRCDLRAVTNGGNRWIFRRLREVLRRVTGSCGRRGRTTMRPNRAS